MSPPDKAKTSATFTSWKLDVEKAMLSDERIPDGALRMMLRILHATNEDTGLAFVGDELLADEIPRCSRSKCHRVRVLGTKLGWWEVEPGIGSKPSIYRFKDTNVNAIFDINGVMRDERKEKRKRKRKEGRQRWIERRRVTDDTTTKAEDEGAVVSSVTRLPDEIVVSSVTRQNSVDVSPVTHAVVSPVQHVHLRDTPSLVSLSGNNGIPDSTKGAGSDEITLPRPPSPADAERIFTRYIGRGDPERGEYIASYWLDFSFWLERYAKHGLTDRECRAIRAELNEDIEAYNYRMAKGEV